MRRFQQNKTASFFALISLPSTAMGFALCVQLSALSWILITRYGLDIHEVGLVWAAGPLAGIIGQVIIGLLSDRVWFWNGRRRPFILVGGVLATLMLLALPDLDGIAARLGAGGILGVAITVALTLDLAINVSFNPTRALIADVTEPGDERTRGYTWMQSISGTFGVLAYAIGAVWNNYVLIYSGSVIVLLFSVLPTLLIAEPQSLPDDRPAEAETPRRRADSLAGMLLAIRPLWGFLLYDIYAMGRRLAGVQPDGWLAEIVCGLLTAALVVQALTEKERAGSPAAFRKVIAAHSFSWVGIQTTFVFMVPYLQQALPGLSDIQLGRVNSMWLLVLNAVGAALPALLLMPLAHRFGRVRTHTLALACSTAGYFGLWWFGKTPLLIYVLIAIVGIGWAAIVSLPFAIVSQKVSQARMGLFMGLFNLSVVLPQLVVSLGIALLVQRAADKGVIFTISAIALGVSTLAWCVVREDD